MYNSKEVANNIKKLSNSKGITITKMLSDIGLSKNTIANLNSGSMLKADSVGKIADYLDTSIDYLLGRSSDAGSMNITNNNSSISGNAQSQYNNTSSEQSQDHLTQELIEIFSSCSKTTQLEILKAVCEIAKID